VKRVTGLTAAVLATLVVLSAPPAANAHAVLKGTDPRSGTTVKREPSGIVFRFSEPVEGNFGAVQVYDRSGKRVESGASFHPGGQTSQLGTKLKPGLPRGSYTATYRVISADGHPVSGGLVFSIGKPSAPGATVSELLKQRGNAGHVTQVAFGVARGLQYASIGLAIGGVFFLFVIWLPAMAVVAGGRAEWLAASEAFVARLRRVFVLVAATGVLSSALGILLQGATAAGTSFWSALDPQVVRDVLGTRFGTVWGIRLLVWLGISGAMAAALAGRRRPVLRPAEVGATGLALVRPNRSYLGFGILGLLFAALGFLALSPALSGHASLQHPTGVLFPANVIHVIAMSIWAGGLALLIFVLPVATRRLEPPDRTRLLASTLARFSIIAGIAFPVLLLTGLTQSIVEVRTLHNAIHTAFGRAALIKFCLVTGPLLALGAYNRRRSVPQLKQIAAAGGTPGSAGVFLRRALRAEVALIVVVLGVTSALVSYPPSIAQSSGGPVSVTESLGPADLQLTVDPARVGPNQMHAYLIDKRTGQQYDRVKEFRVELELPKKALGPLKADSRRAGPGHYVMPGTVFGVSGDWLVKMSARVSKFDAYYATAKVRIR
jgi:copper transport protein